MGLSDVTLHSSAGQQGQILSPPYAQQPMTLPPQQQIQQLPQQQQIQQQQIQLQQQIQQQHYGGMQLQYPQPGMQAMQAMEMVNGMGGGMGGGMVRGGSMHAGPGGVGGRGPMGPGMPMQMQMGPGGMRGMGGMLMGGAGGGTAGRGGEAPTRAVVVPSLPAGVSCEEICDAVGGFGPIESIELAADRAHVSFVDVGAAYQLMMSSGGQIMLQVAAALCGIGCSPAR